jgi:hypothetical protein
MIGEWLALADVALCGAYAVTGSSVTVHGVERVG